MADYMREAYGDAWHGSPEALLRDGFGAAFEMQVVELAGGTVGGLAAWRRTYDLHHCTCGGEIVDMFVLPALRGKGVGPALVCAVAAEVLRAGGVFLRGQSVEEPSVRRLYDRVAVGSAVTEFTIAGRALRTLAELAGSPPLSMARGLPDKSWNYEA